MGNNQDSPLHRFDEQQALRHDFGDYPLIPEWLFDAEAVSRCDTAVESVIPRIRESYTVAEALGISEGDSDNEREYVELVPVKREEG